jgi:CHASE3 domain sensor protein
MLVNVKIGPKLTGGFAAVALLCGAVGLIGITSMTSIKERVDEVTGLTVPQLDKLSEYQVGLAAMRRYEFGLSLAQAEKDETLFASYIEDATRDRSARVEGPRAAFEAIPRSTEAEALWSEVKRHESAYLASFDEAVAAYRADRDAEAVAIVLGQSRTRYAELAESFVALNARLTETAEARGAQVEAIYASRRLIIAASVLGGRSSKSVAPQVATGSSRNCGTSPASTARGTSATRRKSATRSSSATEKTMVASTRLRMSCWVVMAGLAQALARAKRRTHSCPNARRHGHRPAAPAFAGR